MFQTTNQLKNVGGPVWKYYAPQFLGYRIDHVLDNHHAGAQPNDYTYICHGGHWDCTSLQWIMWVARTFCNLCRTPWQTLLESTSRCRIICPTWGMVLEPDLVHLPSLAQEFQSPALFGLKSFVKAVIPAPPVQELIVKDCQGARLMKSWSATPVDNQVQTQV